MRELFSLFYRRLARTELRFERYLAKEINWGARMVGITGARGAGKTTLLFQHILREFGKTPSIVLYVSLDHLYFTTHTLLDLAEEFYKNGGVYLYLDAWVTKGTYIRVLADDIGRRLGAFAHLTALRRTAVGDLRIEDAVPFAEIDTEAKTTEEKRAYLKGADFLLQSLPAVTLSADEAARLKNGQRLAVKSSVRGEARAYGPEKNLLGVVEVDARGVIHPVRLMRNLENDPS